LNGQQTYGFIDGRSEQQCSGILIHHALGKKSDMQTLSGDQSDSEPRSKHIDEPKLRHGDTADKECSKPNIEAESEEAVLLLGQQKQAGCQYLPVRTPKAPDKGSLACR
jgi:hypothetical protein